MSDADAILHITTATVVPSPLMLLLPPKPYARNNCLRKRAKLQQFVAVAGVQTAACQWRWIQFPADFIFAALNSSLQLVKANALVVCDF